MNGTGGLSDSASGTFSYGGVPARRATWSMTALRAARSWPCTTRRRADRRPAAVRRQRDEQPVHPLRRASRTTAAVTTGNGTLTWKYVSSGLTGGSGVVGQLGNGQYYMQFDGNGGGVETIATAAGTGHGRPVGFRPGRTVGLCLAEAEIDACMPWGRAARSTTRQRQCGSI